MDGCAHLRKNLAYGCLTTLPIKSFMVR